MAKIVINDKTISASEIEVNPHVDEKQNTIFETISIAFSELPIEINHRKSYNGHIEGENEHTKKVEKHNFNNYKVASVTNNRLVLVHPDFYFNYELEIYTNPRK